MITLFKKVADGELEASPDFPMTVKLTDITQLTGLDFFLFFTQTLHS